MSLLNDARRSVLDLLKTIGGPMTLTKVTKGAYDPSAGAPASSTSTDYTVQCAIIQYKLEEMQPGIIERGDRKAIVSVLDANGDVLSISPEAGDELTSYGDKVRIVGVRRISVGANAAVFICQVRE